MKQVIAIFALLLTMLLNACATQVSVPEDRFYRLPVLINKQKNEPPITKILMVGPIQARGIYNERAILYIEDVRPLEVLRYHYHYWLQNPTQLIQENLLAYLRSAGLATNAVPYGIRVRHDYQLSGRLLRFERLIRKDGIYVIARIEFIVEKSGRLVFSHIYEQTERAANDEMHATADAMGHALEKIYQQLYRDIRQPLDQ